MIADRGRLDVGANWDAKIELSRQALRQGARVLLADTAGLRRLGGVKPPREFVLMDRAAIGLGVILGDVLRFHVELGPRVAGRLHVGNAGHESLGEQVARARAADATVVFLGEDIANEGGVFRSTDRGESWTNRTGNYPVPGGSKVQVVFDA